MKQNSTDSHNPMHQPNGCDIVITGAGLIGLSIALELHSRGASVIVIERGRALQHASIAAAGMLAVEDPHNPPALLPLSRLSMELYPAFLERIAALSGTIVPFQTATAFQHSPDGSAQKLNERSLDPRELAAALLKAIRATSIRLIEDTTIRSINASPSGLLLRTNHGNELSAGHLIYASGSWTPYAISPRKGQMLRVKLPSPLKEVHRSEHVYIVPRTMGLQAGTAIIGATVENAGFDTTVHRNDLARLRSLAAELLPALAAESLSPMVEAWAGLRPATPDALPLLGALPIRRQLIASGHFRNGILLAPATASVIADMLEKKQPHVDLTPFAPERFAALAAESNTAIARHRRYSPKAG